MTSPSPVTNVKRFPVAIPHFQSGTQWLCVNGRNIPPIAYMSYFGKPTLYKQAANAGIHLYCFPIILGDRGVNTFSGIGPFRPSVWTGEDTLDMAAPLRDAQMILDADPEAWLITRINLDVPSWWETAHPEGCCRLSDGSTLRQSFYSSIWLDATERILRLLLTKLADSDIASRLIGVHLAAGRTSEWFYHFQPDRGFEDENPQRIADFRKWVRERYQTEATLKTAWGNEEADFDSITPADIRGIEKIKAWRDPESDQPALDTLRFHSETMANCISKLCRVVKQATDGRLITGAFYGYHVFLNDARWGHGALSRLLECPDLDGLASPNAYRRVPGEDWPPMAAVDSARLHGKLWFAENDTRTHRTTLLKDVAPDICPPGKYADGVWLGPHDPWIAKQLLWKNAARMLACGYGGWWFDMWGGWFEDAELQEVFSRHRNLAELPPLDPPEMRPQVCVIADETANFYDRSFGSLAEKIFQHRYTLGKIGTPYAIFLPSDMARLPAGSYRFVWALGCTEREADLTEAVERICGSAENYQITDVNGSRLPDGRLAFSSDAEHEDAAEEVRAIIKGSGVHLYLQTNDVLYAGRGWVGVHAVEAGEKRLRLPFTARVTDAIRDRCLSVSTDDICLKLKRYETALLRVEPSL